MPSVSKKQHNLMAMVANDPAAAKRVGIPQSVGEEYMKADKGKKFGSGGTESRADLQAINKPKVHRGKMALFAKGGEMAESKAMVKKEIGFMKKSGAPKSMIKHEESEMKGMKKGGMKKYDDGGMKRGGKKMASGGSFRKVADGIASKGKTKGTQVKMCGGGMSWGKK